MANFRTHIGVGVVASGMLATLTMASSLVPSNELIKLALVGAVGSVLPDIDLQNSRASQAMFSTLALFVAFTLLFNFAWKYSIAEMWIVWVGVFVLIRFVAHNIFHRYAVHRGTFHSVLAGLFFASATAIVFHSCFGSDSTIAWLAGAFMFFGYMVHLLLDELYSVDFNNNRVKRSFGTALKIFDGKHPKASFGMLAAALVAWYLAPESATFFAHVTDPEVWAFLSERLLPEGSWFGIIADMVQVATL
ncbi:MAG: metal-dependent hydrolase [Pseudomonadota bacterium]